MSRVVKRSVSLPVEVDAAIEAAALARGVSVSGWLAEMAGQAVQREAALAAVADWEAEHGRFTDDELAEGRRWVEDLLRSTGPAPVTPRP